MDFSEGSINFPKYDNNFAATNYNEIRHMCKGAKQNGNVKWQAGLRSGSMTKIPVKAAKKS